MKHSASVAVFLLLAGMRVAEADAPATAPAPSPQHRQVLAEYPIGGWGELIAIPVVKGDKHGVFILDTNAGLTMLNAADFPEIQPLATTVNVGTAGGARRMQLYHPPDLHIGPFSLADSGPLFRIDLAEVQTVLDSPVLGLLGYSAVKNVVVQLDYDNHQVRFLRPDDQPHPEWGNAVVMEPNARHSPAVEFPIAGAPQSFEVDTGNNGSISLPTRAFDRLHDALGRPLRTIPTLTANGTVDLRIMRVNALDLAGSTHRNLLLNEVKLTSGSMGLEFLERHLATLDFPGKHLYLKPGREFDHPSEDSMAGLRVRRTNGKLIARSVDSPSPAFDAGIRTGDVITDLNGKPAERYSVFQIHEMMIAGDGRDMTVTYRRDQEPHTVTFTLRRGI